MVNGFEKFKEHFVGYEDCYTIIGGTACDILMNDASADLSIADGTLRITLSGSVYNEVNEFISIMKAEPVNLKNLHLDDFAPETYYRILSSIYISE
ncbi:MAG: hypothetical protein LUG99_11615 [Lachnospiraceae bacterium]|nr:hypothetical protein [Lachnospiraceae bacterium]